MDFSFFVEKLQLEIVCYGTKTQASTRNMQQNIQFSGSTRRPTGNERNFCVLRRTVSLAYSSKFATLWC
ncbi:uncharacterized protein PHALS_02954 [Plasmopara halstedii]|uniref:Uncharacterized protein n=1 Tax=Plasmopara halstedii TaxID=4781 RepID=A0A0N7L7A8_PLAHL|nr:uncharacterized protein PHALS_02954 [Plasmopara halstedii]CEG46555.1 hypothetical protein PHALS_02954 [Plasmopara halstedii]|eukprot:XP_024582924.1 hypothetical protein PHALS_02954 [Plasmopara halstedii]